MSWEDRFWSKIDVRGPDECWPWLASKSHGYGKFTLHGKTVRAHRIAYHLLVGIIPSWATIDHVKARGCTRTDCCNPAHMEPVLISENVLRGDGPCAVNSRKTHCIHGHEFTPENTRPLRGGRACRQCDRDATRRRVAADPEAHRARSRESMRRTRARRSALLDE